MRLAIVGVGVLICPLLWAQYPNRPAAHAPAPFALGMPTPSQSAARPPIAPVQPGLRGPVAGLTGSNLGVGRYRPSNRRGRGTGYGAGYYFVPYYYLSSPYDAGPYDAYQYAAPDEMSAAQSADLTANLLGEQLHRLTAEVAQLRNSQPPPLPPPGANDSQPPQEAPAVTPITVILRDGQQLQVRSFAVMDKVFWDFSQQPAKRIPVTNIDVAASTKATEAAGGEFPTL